MCLGVPGRILSIAPDPIGTPMGRVDFGGIVKEACLAYVPEAEVGDYIIVHAGFALSRLDAEEAQATLELLREIGALNEVAPPNE